MMMKLKPMLLAACLSLLSLGIACSGSQDTADAEPAEQPAPSGDDAPAEEGDTAEEGDPEATATDEGPTPQPGDAQEGERSPTMAAPTSPNPDALAGDGSEDGDALCVRNCKGWELCAGEENLGPEFGLENCVEQCETTQKSACGGEFETFVDCALQQSCDRWMASGGDRLEGCEQEFDDAMACMAGLEGPPTMEQ